jgi:hypothetical protein
MDPRKDIDPSPEVTVTMAPMRLHAGSLRETAEKIEDATGLRIEIIGGVLMMSPTPRGKHGGVVYQLEKMIRPSLPESLVALQMASLDRPDDPDDYVTPDLLVGPADFLESDDWLIDPDEVELAVEVISKSEVSVDWYAVAGVRLLLVVDPRNGTWALYFHPRDGSYQGVLRGKYGESIPLPSPLELSLDTSRFPIYGEKKTSRS